MEPHDSAYSQAARELELTKLIQAKELEEAKLAHAKASDEEKIKVERDKLAQAKAADDEKLKVEREKLALEKSPSKKYLGALVVLAAAVIAASSTINATRTADRTQRDQAEAAKKDRVEQDRHELARLMLDKQDLIFKRENAKRSRAILQVFYPDLTDETYAQLQQELPSADERFAVSETSLTPDPTKYGGVAIVVPGASAPASRPPVAVNPPVAKPPIKLPPIAYTNGRPDWEQHLDWAIADHGAADCPQQYPPELQSCRGSGNRSCLMKTAIELAKKGDGSQALALALITQCHSPNAQIQLRAAGQDAIASYLAKKPG